MIGDMTANAAHRVFFAMIPSEETVERLAHDLAEVAWRKDSRLRWVAKSNWHVTLRFVGDIAEPLVADLQQVLTSAASQHTRFEMAFTAVEAFPSARRPLVIAATGTAPAAGDALVGSLEESCQALSLAAEKRPWRPHMTVARVRGRRRFELPTTPTQVKFMVSRICLMESVATERGRAYVPLRWAALR